MKINNHLNTPNNNNYNKANPNFGRKITPQSVFEFVGNQCRIASNGSLTREMFFIVGGCFMMGGRYLDARGNDEKREILTRDIPAVALAVGGAPLINTMAAKTITTKTGIPLITFNEKGKKVFATQKQIIDWYSDFSKLKDPVLDFSETINRNKGNVKKTFEKLGIGNELNAISNAAENESVINAINNAKNGNEQSKQAFDALETALKSKDKSNKLLNFAKNRHAGVKISGILLTAALLGYLLPRLNIVITRNKYLKPAENEKQTTPMEAQLTKMYRNWPALNFHNKSAAKTFQSFFI